MKRVVAVLTFLVVLTGVLCSCSTADTQVYNYKDGYDRLYKDVVEHDYALEELNDNTLRKFSKDDICVCLGDSLLGGFEAPNDYATVIANETGMTTVNCGIANSRMAAHSEPGRDAFSFYRLADAIATGDWSLQDANVSSLAAELVIRRYNDLKAVDWENVDVVTIAFGTMDINGQVAIDDPADPVSTATLMGALRYSLNRILTAYPHLKVMIVTPTYRYFIDEGKSCEELLFGGHRYEEYIDGIITVARQYNLPYVDLYRTLGFNSITRSYYYDSNDGAHPNMKGRTRMGERIANAILLEF